MTSMNTSVSISHFDHANPLNTVSIASRPTPIPRAGEALVRITLRPVNPSDAYSTMGFYPGFQPTSWPAVPGLEGVGTIEAFGEGVQGLQDRLKVGQRVVALEWGAGTHGQGTWQQYRTVDVDQLVPVPDEVPDHFAATATVNGVTVIGLLEAANVPSGGTLLVTAAGSSLNLLVVKLATSRGIKVIGTARRPEARDALLAKGFSDIIVTKEGEGLAEAVKAATGGKGADAALDSIVGPIFTHVVASVRDDGKVIAYGAQSGVHDLTFGLADLTFRSINVTAFWCFKYLRIKGTAEARKVLAEALRLNQEGLWATEPGEEVPLEKATEVIMKQFNPGQGKKIFLKG